MKKETNDFIELSSKELDVLNVLWDINTPTIASDIPKLNPNLNSNTVQATVKKLLKRKLIKVADIVYSGTVLTRSYVPTFSAKEYTEQQLLRNIERYNKFVSKSELVSCLIDASDNDTELIREIESMIQQRKAD